MRSLLAVSLCAPLAAQAFCGFYVSGASGQLFNDASMVVLMRDGTRTVLSMQNNYRGPVEDFALVVPVPTVLQKGNVTTLPREAFVRLDELTSPRLVEMSTDQCIGAGLKGSGCPNCGAGASSGDLAGMPRDLGVKVEAKFDVEEYEIVILSAELALGLEIWLKENKYKIPDGAAETLKPYVQGGSKFFVAKVNAKKAKFKDGQLVLSPLRFSYDTETFSLPVRMGLLNSGGTQDLIVHIIAKSRYELANAKNVLVPTNFDVRTRVQPQFGAFYSELVSRTFKKNPGAAITEFAWEGALPPPVEYVGGGIYGVTCDPCPPPHPVDNPLAGYLGAKLMPKIKTDEGIAAFARAATITRLHLRYTKDSPPDDLVFKAVDPVAGGVPEVKTAGPAKHNRFQGRYVMWVSGCNSIGSVGGFGGIGIGSIATATIGGPPIGGGGPQLAFYSAGSALNRPPGAQKLIDPFEQLIVHDLPELDVKAVPLAKDAPKVQYVPAASLTPMPAMVQAPAAPAGRVDVLAPQVEGDLSPDVVRRVGRSNLSQMRYCYDLELKRNPSLQGRVTVKLVINAAGRVVMSSVADDTTGDPALGQCLANRVRAWSFPQPDANEVVVSWPFTFRPQ